MSRSKLFMKKLFHRSNSEEKINKNDSPFGSINVIKKKRHIRRSKSWNIGCSGEERCDIENLNSKKNHSTFEPSRNSRDSLSVLGLMFYAVEYNNSEMLDQLIYENKEKIDINQCNEDGIAIVHYAAMVGSIESFVVLQKYNADLNVEDIRGNSPLDYSTLMKTIEISRYLIKKGCRSNKHKSYTLTIGSDPIWQDVDHR